MFIINNFILFFYLSSHSYLLNVMCIYIFMSYKAVRYIKSTYIILIKIIHSSIQYISSTG